LKWQKCILWNFGRRLVQMLRNIARKPLSKMQTYLKYGFVVTEHEQYLCPRCKSALNAGPNYQPKNCSQCGQRVTFAGTEWRDDRIKGYVDEEKRGGFYEPFKDRMV